MAKELQRAFAATLEDIAAAKRAEELQRELERQAAAARHQQAVNEFCSLFDSPSGPSDGEITSHDYDG